MKLSIESLLEILKSCSKGTEVIVNVDSAIYDIKSINLVTSMDLGTTKTIFYVELVVDY